MPYYRGDAYYGRGGNYYRGDPFLGAVVGSLIGGAAKKVGRWVGSKIGGSAGRASATVAPIIRDIAPAVAGGAVGVAVGQKYGPSISPIPQIPQISPGMAAGVVPMYRKSRRMNPLNPRALKRALRRAEGFEKFAKRTVNAMYRVIDGRKVRTYKKTSKRS